MRPADFVRNTKYAPVTPSPRETRARRRQGRGALYPLSPSFAAFAASLADPQSAEDHLGGTKLREGGLQQVPPDKNRQPGPVRIYPMRQCQTGEDQRAGERADCVFHFHIVSASVEFRLN